MLETVRIFEFEASDWRVPSLGRVFWDENDVDSSLVGFYSGQLADCASQ